DMPSEAASSTGSTPLSRSPNSVQIISRLAGAPDPRAGGSGNPGATNMLRLAGKRLAIWTLFGDLLKGVLPVLLAASLGMSVQQQAWIGLAAVLGHLYPLY